jgi:hypothetical protein
MWSLGRRFSPHPQWATLLFLAVPAFVVNGNSLETDLPFLAFWMAAIALFCSGRVWLSALPMALAAMTAYQAVFLTPILAVYVAQSSWPVRSSKDVRRLAPRLLILLTPVATVAAYQLFERLSSGAMPAGVLAGYFSTYGFQQLQKKLASALMLFIHSWFLVFPALVPGALLLAWRKRRDRETQFLLAWIALFFAGAVVVFFAGSARYLLPMAAPVALLASRLNPRWLAPAFGAQLALGLGLAAVNYQHWDACRSFARTLRGPAENHRVWVDAELGLRHYLEEDGALPLTKTTRLRAGDILVTSELEASVRPTAPLAPVARVEVRPAIPLRLIGIESESGYSTVSRGYWPFGIWAGAIDRIRAERVAERNPTLEYLPMNAPDAANQIVSGVFSLEGQTRWVSKAAVFVLKNPPAAQPLHVELYIPPQAPARSVTLLLDGKQVASRSYPGEGAYRLESPPVRGAGASALVEVVVDKTFTAPPDTRELGIVLSAVGFGK